ncbi:adenylate/guanylate cyclase domain-containing protein [Tistrella mobilis]|uniref:GGDEF domain containing protein n=1 Tax=Tistrella mobilis (strain KA081020-065) TaxID=1110502 RepID=I3TIK8_TISMK|nr:adenylate/guanylate cyclase domain-containing protein [Tistrella mobilis]AFK52596.1 GGDEF domain containing protein [Tistrella mobilis KA081020-065]
MALLALVLIAVLVIGLQTLIGRRAADQMAAEIGAGLAEVAQQVADRFDREIWSRSNESLLSATDRPVVIDTHRRAMGVDGTPGPHLLNVAAPAVTPDGARHGTLIAWLGWDWGRDIQRDLGRALRRDRPLEILVADAAGQVIIGPEAAIGQPVPRSSAMPAADGRNGWGAAGWIARPLRRIAQAADRIRSGDDGVEISEVGGATEVELLSRSLRALIDRLTHSRSELDQALSAAGRDALTGLPNRRFFDEVLHLLTDRIAAHNGTLGVIFMDLDGGSRMSTTFTAMRRAISC